MHGGSSDTMIILFCSACVMFGSIIGNWIDREQRLVGASMQWKAILFFFFLTKAHCKSCAGA